MKTHHANPTDQNFRPMNPVFARLLKMFGPADSWDNPLVGTKYEPGVRQRQQLERRHAKQIRRVERKTEHDRHRAVVEEPESDHHTPDEA